MEIKVFFQGDNEKSVKKAWWANSTQLGVKYTDNGATKIVLLDFRHLDKISIYENTSAYITSGIQYISNPVLQLTNPPDTDNLPETPYYIFIAEGETETPETPTETILFPPPETPEEFLERIGARIYHLSNRIDVLSHARVHQNAKSEEICREVDENDEEVLRYDISNNLIKRPVGWLMSQIETFHNRYTRHLESVEKAKKAGRTLPNFNGQRDMTSIETMLEKLEEHITEQCIRDHYDWHKPDVWDEVQNKQRKITLCNDDEFKSPGELLVDVNTFFTDGDGNIAQEHAKRTYHDISVKYWKMATRTRHRTLVTERTVEV